MRTSDAQKVIFNTYGKGRGFSYTDLRNAANTIRKGYQTYKKAKKIYDVVKRLPKKPRRRRRTKHELSKNAQKVKSVRPIQAAQFQGHVKEGKKKSENVNIFMDKGSLLRLERGGTEAASDLNHAVYVGYGTPMKLVTESMYRAILKKLCQKAGYFIRDFERPAGYDLYSAVNIIDKDVRLRIRYQYRYASTTTTPSTLVSEYPILNSSAVYAASTWAAIAQDMDSAVAGLISTGTVEASGGNNFVIDNIALSLYTLHAGVTESDVPLSNLNAQDIILHFEVNTGMKVSNITKAASSDGDEYATDNILANPLTGKLYTIKKWSNAFVQKHLAYNDASGVLLAPTDTEPIFSTSSDTTNAKLLKKPPKFYFFDNCKYEQPVNLEPGHIKQFGTRFQCTMTINTFMNKYLAQVGLNTTQITGPSQAAFGYTQLIGLECMLNNRAETSAVTAVDFELNQSIGCYVSIKKAITQPIIDIA